MLIELLFVAINFIILFEEILVKFNIILLF